MSTKETIRAEIENIDKSIARLNAKRDEALQKLGAIEQLREG
jgi:hypothetical protein